MRTAAVRAMAAAATMAVLAGGAVWNRDLFVQIGASGFEPTVTDRLVVDAGPGVRVRVEGVTGRLGIDIQTRATFARSSVEEYRPGLVVARCETPTPLSRCVVWISVTLPTSATVVEVRKHPGATVGGPAPSANVIVHDVV